MNRRFAKCSYALGARLKPAVPEETPRLPILAILLAGLCLGGAVRYWAIDHESATADSSLEPQREITSENPQFPEEDPHLPQLVTPFLLGRRLELSAGLQSFAQPIRRLFEVDSIPT